MQKLTRGRRTAQTRSELSKQALRDTSLVPDSAAESLNATAVKPKLASQPRREKTSKDERMSFNKHSVFVLSKEGNPLTPTIPAKARKLLKAKVAKKVWSKFGTFGIQLLTDSRIETPLTALGVDNGTKFEGYSVVVGDENPLNVKLDLPDKGAITKKIEERRALRRARRFRNCRRRAARFDNRKRAKDWIAPSQSVVVNSRLKLIKEFFKLYPINAVGIEDVRFNHAKYRWGKNFSTVEIGKAKLRAFFKSKGIKIFEYRGYETEELRKKYGYRKTQVKNADKFTAHCSDSLSLAVNVSTGVHVTPGLFIVVNDTYRPKRRHLHDTQPAKSNIREVYSRGTVFGLRKGLMIGAKNKIGQLCGENKGTYRYYDLENKRQSARRLLWISSNFKTRKAAMPLPAKADSPFAE